MVTAGVLGGMCAGFVSNPVDCVFARMQVDELYPVQYRRNYRNFIDGFAKTYHEGALMRGAVPNGMRLGALCASMTGIYDLAKETSYFTLGPHYMNRLWAMVAATIVGHVVTMPFDTVRVRMQTMRRLPNGEFPYHGTIDCFNKIS
jgi:solute carrier family 25 oxoglutarate transporter 11